MMLLLLGGQLQSSMVRVVAEVTVNVEEPYEMMVGVETGIVTHFVCSTVAL